MYLFVLKEFKNNDLDVDQFATEVTGDVFCY